MGVWVGFFWGEFRRFFGISSPAKVREGCEGVRRFLEGGVGQLRGFDPAPQLELRGFYEGETSLLSLQGGGCEGEASPQALKLRFGGGLRGSLV